MKTKWSVPLGILIEVDRRRLAARRARARRFKFALLVVVLFAAGMVAAVGGVLWK